MRPTKRILLASSIALASLASVALAAERSGAGDSLRAGFASPPDSAKPRVWWHWMNANITKPGIKADLEWMKRVGIGGFQNFDGGGANVPRIVPPVIYMTPEWKDAFHYAMQTASGLGLEAARAASAGWSETGGPWVEPKEAMKKYVWSETWVEGGKPFAGRLPEPPKTTGPIRDVPARALGGTTLPEYYADARIFAYRAPDGARSQAELRPTVTASGLATPEDMKPLPVTPGEADGSDIAAPGGSPPPPAAAPDKVSSGPGVPLDAAMLSDGLLQTFVNLPATTNINPVWVRFDYAQPTTVAGLTISTGGINRTFIIGHMFPNFGEPDFGPRLRVDASDDGRAWRAVAEDFYNGAQRTIAIPATTARYFRVVFLESPTPHRSFRGSQPTWVPAISLSELELHPVASVHRLEAKANFATLNDYFAVATPAQPANVVVKKSDVVDLTGKMAADGRLDWTPPPGRWVIVRLGYSLTGHQNGPAPVEATGLEVDKLSAKYVGRYMDTYIGLLRQGTGDGLMGKQGLQYLLNDSYEAGFQNWTDDILDQFKTRRGYDPAPYLPALTGAVVQGSAETDKFLYDWRRTIYELLAQSHYKVVTEKAHAAGMGTYQEAIEDRRPAPGDDMEMRQYADVPMAAMWAFPADGKPHLGYLADDRGAASVANIYGRKYVAAESFTNGGYDTTPKSLKHVADVELVSGVNRFVIHTSVHQPTDKGPGMSLGGVGVFFSRNETWAEMAKAWTDYLARSSYLLQQGKAATEIAYFYGQEAPITGIWGFQLQNDVPDGYDYDYVNADVILNHMTVKGGRLTTPTGMSYRILQMGDRTAQITLPVLKKLRDFVREGATVVGKKPTNSPSLADDANEFQRIAGELWGDGAAGEHAFGKGKVVVGKPSGEVLAGLGASKDLDYTKPRTDTTIWWKHRRLADGDLYFVVNRTTDAQTLEVSVRATGKAVELWDPTSGRARPATYRTVKGRTVVPLKLGSLDSAFLVLRKAGPAARTVPEPVETAVADLGGGWHVDFQPDRGAPASTEMPKLASWTESGDAGEKYFSGVGTYRKTVGAPAAWFVPGAHLWLDLGDVREVAAVVVNGKDLGVAWRAPYRVDLMGALKPGRNEVVIKVANTWVNRLVGDKQPGVTTPVSFSLTNPYQATTPLPPSGLLGPVRLISTR